MGKNKISLSIAGSEFIINTEEDRSYTLELARIVDGKIRALLENTKLSTSLAAMLVCLELCDENEKNKQACARLRDEIKHYLAQVDAQHRAQEELENLKQENRLLRDQIAQYEAGQVGFNT